MTETEIINLLKERLRIELWDHVHPENNFVDVALYLDDEQISHSRLYLHELAAEIKGNA